MPAADWRAARLASECSGRLVREDSAEDLNVIRAGAMTGRAERCREFDNGKHPRPGIETEKARTKAQEGEMKYPSPGPYEVAGEYGEEGDYWRANRRDNPRK